MGQVRVTRTLNAQSEFARRAKYAGKAKIRPRIDKIGARAVELAEAQIQSDFIVDRPTARRKAGSRRLAGSMRHEVTDRGGDFPFVIRLYSRAAAWKVNPLEKGAKPHEISTSKVGGLWLPVRPEGKKLTPRESAYQTKKEPIGRQSVRHPGNKAYGFMRNSLERAASETLGRAVRAKRKQ